VAQTTVREGECKI